MPNQTLTSMWKQPKIRAKWTQCPLQLPYAQDSSDRRDTQLRVIPTVAIGIGAGSIEALDTAGLAEGMLGTTGVKGVGRKVVSTLGRQNSNHLWSPLPTKSPVLSHCPLPLSPVQPFTGTATKIPQSRDMKAQKKLGKLGGSPFFS